jgi:hypothetical protein
VRVCHRPTSPAYPTARSQSKHAHHAKCARPFDYCDRRSVDRTRVRMSPGREPRSASSTWLRPGSLVPTEFGPDLGGHAQSTFPILDIWKFWILSFKTHPLRGLGVLRKVLMSQMGVCLGAVTQQGARRWRCSAAPPDSMKEGGGGQKIKCGRAERRGWRKILTSPSANPPPHPTASRPTGPPTHLELGELRGDDRLHLNHLVR